MSFQGLNVFMTSLSLRCETGEISCLHASPVDASQFNLWGRVSARRPSDSLWPASSSLCLITSPPVLRLNISDSDMLTITDGDEVTTRILGRYVGGSSPFKLSSTTPDLTVTFHSDPAGLVFGKGEGFIINYMGESDVQGPDFLKHTACEII